LIHLASIQAGIVHGISFDAFCPWQSVLVGKAGRREAFTTVGSRWIDGLWPELCRFNWESVASGRLLGRPLAAVPSKGGPTQLGKLATALPTTPMGSKAGFD
jgi:hypothetical protein